MQKKGQTSESQFFGNNKESKYFKEFLEWIGTLIELKNWGGEYHAGLDTKSNKTGTHSVFTKFKDFDIMFHVSTMLPYVEQDEQQLERKRHIGNDVVVIIYQEGDTPFDPCVMRSYFNHVFFVIRRDKKESKLRNKTMYRIAITYKPGVHNFGPTIKSDPYEIGDDFRNFLLTKLINAERAAYHAKSFRTAIERTKEVLIGEVFDEFYPQGALLSGWTISS